MNYTLPQRNCQKITDNSCIYCSKSNTITIPAYTIIEHPICITSFSSQDKLHITVGTGSHVQLIECITHNQTESTLNIELYAHASLMHIRNEYANISCTSRFKALVNAHAQLQCITVSATKNTNKHCHVCLQGEQACLTLYNLSLAHADCMHQQHIRIEHMAPKTYSSQICKGVVSGQSHTDTQVIIHNTAQKANSNQLSRFLTIGNQALTYNKPELQVFADDVSAKHGASCGQIETQALQYMTARGIGKKTAQHLITYGFCKEILTKLPIQQACYFENILQDFT